MSTARCVRQFPALRRYPCLCVAGHSFVDRLDCVVTTARMTRTSNPFRTCYEGACPPFGIVRAAAPLRQTVRLAHQPEPSDAMTTIYDELRNSHATQRRLCNSMVRTNAKNATRRQQLFRELRIELAAHAAAEERYLYVPILMHDMGLNSARHALAEHHDMDELVEELHALDPAGDAWSNKAGELVHEVRHHLKEEETKFFQLSGKLLSDTQKLKLAHQYRTDFERMQQVVTKHY
jgi:hypothetical protein